MYTCMQFTQHVKRINNISRKKSEKGESVHLPKECAIKVFKPLPISHADDESRPASAAVWAHREFQVFLINI